MSEGKPPINLRIAVTAVFASLIALGTILSIPVPQPLYEITWAPAIYLSLAVLSDRWTAFSATAIGGFIGEAINLSIKGGSPIYPFGLVWARAPEVFIVAWAAGKGNKWLAFSMVVATVFETLAFFFPDWLFYTYGLFSYGSPMSVAQGFTTALPDLFTMVDVAFIPVAFGIIYAARPAFRRLGFQTKLQEPKEA
ncbi:MAG: hypothetical protein OK474_08550 [Thaumarchaeota archaeon]|nr:hypothetical protein [Nitrososphaerota archaeon]